MACTCRQSAGIARRWRHSSRRAALEPTRRETHERLGLAWWMAGDGERALGCPGRCRSPSTPRRGGRISGCMVVLDQLGRHEEAAAERAIWLRLFGDGAVAERLAEIVAARPAMAPPWSNGSRCWRSSASGSRSPSRRWRSANTTQALDALERCVDERGDNAPFIAEFPPFRPLRGEPRYERMLENSAWSVRRRQHHRKGRALAGRALDVEPAAMAVDHVLDDGEAEAGAAELARARGVDAVEALGEPRQVAGRNAVALVGNGDGDAIAGRTAAPTRAPSCWAWRTSARCRPGSGTRW